MSEREKAIKFCEDLLAHLKSGDKIILNTLERRPIVGDSDNVELKLVEGAMKTVGGLKVYGLTYEMRLGIWSKEAKEIPDRIGITQYIEQELINKIKEGRE